MTARVVRGDVSAHSSCPAPAGALARVLLRMKLRWACPVWLLAWRPAVFVCKGSDDQVQTVSSNAFSACSTAMAKCCTARLFIGFQELFSTVCCARLPAGNVDWRGRSPGGFISLDCLMTGRPLPARGGPGCTRTVRLLGCRPGGRALAGMNSQGCPKSPKVCALTWNGD